MDDSSDYSPEPAVISKSPPKSPNSKMPLSESPSVSSVTLAEYNRWVVETANKQIAEDRRADMERERQVREKMKQDRLERGQAAYEANKEQTRVAKSVVEAHQKANLERGAQLKDQASTWRQQRKVASDAWMAKAANNNKEFGSELKEKITTNKKEQSDLNRQMFNDVKAELKAYSEIRENRQITWMQEQKQKRDQIVAERKKEKDADMNEEGGFGYRNKKVGETTRAQVKVWREQKDRLKEKHFQDAQKHKTDIVNAKNAAKSARDELQEKRRKEALDVRAHKIKAASEFADQSKEQEKANRIKHNEIRIGRFVPQEMAKAVSADTTFTDAIRYANTHNFNPESLKMPD